MNFFSPIFCIQLTPAQPCRAHSARSRPGRLTMAQLWRATRWAAACHNTHPGHATAHLRTLRPHVTTYAMQTTHTTHLVDHLSPWHCPLQEEALSHALIPLSNSHMTHAKNACLQLGMDTGMDMGMDMGTQRCSASLLTCWISLRSNYPYTQMASTLYSTSVRPVVSSAARVPAASATWWTLSNAYLPNHIHLRHHPSVSLMDAEIVTEIEASAVEVKTAQDTITQVHTSHVQPAVTRAGSAARVEIHAMIPGTPHAIAARQLAGGALTTTWIVTVASWWVEAGGQDGDTHQVMRPWTQPSRN